MKDLLEVITIKLIILVEDDGSHAIEVLKDNLELIEKLSKTSFLIAPKIDGKEHLKPIY